MTNMFENLSGIPLYAALIADAEVEVSYWEDQPESEEKTHQLEVFKDLIDAHREKIVGLLEQEGDKRNEIEEMLEWLQKQAVWMEAIIKILPGKVGYSVRQVYGWIMRFITVLREVLATII